MSAVLTGQRAMASAHLKARWASGDPTLRPPTDPIVWNASLDSSLGELLAVRPALSWDAISTSMGICIESCRKRMVALGLKKTKAAGSGRPRRVRNE